ncbi:MAG: hypothetical protein EHM14_04920 [Methanothrix sp.]|nr:MAG: hypothetical protein EHM14_04920 [Methanothrix sp.]
MSLTKTLKDFPNCILDWIIKNLFNDNLIWGFMAISVFIMCIGIFSSKISDDNNAGMSIISIGLAFGFITIVSIIIKVFQESHQQKVKY